MLAFFCGEAEPSPACRPSPALPGPRAEPGEPTLGGRRPDGGQPHLRQGSGGQAWRVRMRHWLEENLNHRVYDPVEEARRLLTEEEFQSLPKWKATDLERYRKALRIVINHALDVMQNQADYVVCSWDEAAARGGGAQAELTAAYRKGIPVYLVTQIPLEQIGGWVLGCVDKIFSSFDELKSSLAAAYGKEARQRGLWGPG